MKTPTKKELQALAVRALGEGATVRIEPPAGRGFPDECIIFGSTAWYAEAGKPYDDSVDGVNIWYRTRSGTLRALAAALTALAEVRK